MVRQIDLSNDPRRAQFDYFRNFRDPYVSVTVPVDITRLRECGTPLFLSYLWCAIRAANAVPELRRRIDGERVVEYDRCLSSHTVALPNGKTATREYTAHGGAVCKGVCKRIVKMTVRGMRRHSRRFIRNYDVVILKEDRQGELFRNNFGGPGLGFVGKVERKPLAGGKTMAHGHTHAVHRNAGRGIFKESQRAGGNVHPPAQKIENGQTVKLGSNVNVHISTATYYNK